MIFSYRTIRGPAYGAYKEKGSKFLGIAYPVSEDEEVAAHLALLKKEHPKARHFCYAYRLDLEKKIFRAHDDGEPSGTAGKPILGQIDARELTKILVVVVRYFGGTKLGAAGLFTAYKEAALGALDSADIQAIKIRSTLEIISPAEVLNEVMRILKHTEMRIVLQSYEKDHILQIEIPLEDRHFIWEKLIHIHSIQCKILS